MLLFSSENDTDLRDINARLVGNTNKSSFCKLVFKASFPQFEILEFQISLDKYSPNISVTHVRTLSKLSLGNSTNDSIIDISICSGGG
jgi:hypothetical protein